MTKLAEKEQIILDRLLDIIAELNVQSEKTRLLYGDIKRRFTEDESKRNTD